MFKPLIPIVGDMLEHSFNEAIHVSTVHAIYGDNHVEKEMAAASDNDSNKNQSSIRFEEQVSVHLSEATFIFTPYLKNSITLYTCFTANKPAAIFLPKHIPPPRFS